MRTLLTGGFGVVAIQTANTLDINQVAQLISTLVVTVVTLVQLFRKNNPKK